MTSSSVQRSLEHGAVRVTLRGETPSLEQVERLAIDTGPNSKIMFSLEHGDFDWSYERELADRYALSARTGCRRPHRRQSGRRWRRWPACKSPWRRSPHAIPMALHDAGFWPQLVPADYDDFYTVEVSGRGDATTVSVTPRNSDESVTVSVLQSDGSGAIVLVAAETTAKGVDQYALARWPGTRASSPSFRLAANEHEVFMAYERDARATTPPDDAAPAPPPRMYRYYPSVGGDAIIRVETPYVEGSLRLASGSALGAATAATATKKTLHPASGHRRSRSTRCAATASRRCTAMAGPSRACLATPSRPNRAARPAARPAGLRGARGARAARPRAGVAARADRPVVERRVWALSAACDAGGVLGVCQVVKHAVLMEIPTLLRSLVDLCSTPR